MSVTDGDIVEKTINFGPVFDSSALCSAVTSAKQGLRYQV